MADSYQCLESDSGFLQSSHDSLNFLNSFPDVGLSRGIWLPRDLTISTSTLFSSSILQCLHPPVSINTVLLLPFFHREMDPIMMDFPLETTDFFFLFFSFSKFNSESNSESSSPDQSS